METLRTVDLTKLHGYWRGSMYRMLGDTLVAAGRGNQALAAYREVVAEAGVSAADRKAAEDAIGTRRNQ